MPVTFPSRDRTLLSGWYIPSGDGSGILLAHGSAATRVSLLREARILAADGHGILLFDFPGHGESHGSVSFGTPARDAVEGGIDFLASRQDIEASRIGALGFSDGGIAVAYASAADDRIRATALVATPGDAERQTAAEYRPFGPVAVLGAELAYSHHGVRLNQLRAEDVVSAISPRAVAILAGTEDGVVHFDEALALYAAARAPKELIAVHHGDHGRYAVNDTAYPRALQRFFRSALARNGR
jgi:dipeptidyl aminopeptidase/acylaminoacyl peptidase